MVLGSWPCWGFETEREDEGPMRLIRASDIESNVILKKKRRRIGCRKVGMKQCALEQLARRRFILHE